MKALKQRLKAWLKAQTGAALSEYVLLITLIAISAMAGLISLQGGVIQLYNKLYNVS